MTINPNAPHFVLAAVKRIYDELPLLVGKKAWDEIQPTVDDYLTQLETQANNHLAMTQIFGLLAQFEPARLRLTEEIKVQEVITKNIENSMSRIAQTLGINPEYISGAVAATYTYLNWEVVSETVPKSNESVSRSITKMDVDNAKSVKFKNMQLDLGDFSRIAAGFIIAGVGVVTTPAIPLVMPLLVVVGVLSTVSALHETMEIEIDEQEASVLLGMTRAIGNTHGAGLLEETILKQTNEEREKYGLEYLNQNRLKHSLLKLEQIEVIKKSDNVYYVVENY